MSTTAIHMRRAGDLFGTPSDTHDSDRLIAASVQWACKIMERIDATFADNKEK